MVQLPSNGWRPRPYQMAAWKAWEKGCKRTLLIWHRRSGKDELSLQKAAVAAHLRPANYWHLLPQFAWGRKAIWEAVNPHSGLKRIDEAFPKYLRTRTDQTTMTIEFKSGAVWRVVGSDNPDSLVGAPPLGIAFSEWALSNPTAWGLLQPILLENGGWADFITTPRGRNHVHGMYEMAKKDPTWFCQTLTVDDTKQLSDEQIEQARAEYKSLYGEEAANALIQQEYFCSFEAAILGAFYGKELALAEQQGRITRVEIWPDVPVHTAWDLGASRGSDTMSIWLWQIVPHESGKSQVRMVGYLSGTSYSIAHYAAEIKKRVDDLGHRRGTDYVPHDARVPEMTSSGKDGKAKLRIEVMIENGMKPKIVTEHHVADGVSAVRQLLPRCWFDEANCLTGVECLRQYQTEWDDDRKMFKRTALSNWASHGADAFRYLAMAFRELAPQPAVEPGRMLTVGVPDLPPGVKPVTLNDLWKDRRQANRRF